MASVIFLNWLQSVKAKNGKTSEAKSITVGIPKLFTYKTDVINNKKLALKKLKSNMAKYSDDTRLVYGFNKLTSDDDQVAYQATINNLCLLSTTINLKLNPN